MSTTTEPRVKIIEHATRDDIRPGDHVVWEWTRQCNGVTITERREGIASYRGTYGDWCTGERRHITDGEGDGSSITIRRTVQDSPTKPGTVLAPADGHEYITATVAGVTYRAREAILLEPSYWHAAWRSDGGVMTHVTPEHLDAGTWTEGTR